MYKFLKYVFDVLLALIALACVSWLLLPCMLILWCTGEHKVWYLQKRVGYRNRIFSIFKFATMLKNSPNMGTGSLTTRNDPRVLPFGRFLRNVRPGITGLGSIVFRDEERLLSQPGIDPVVFYTEKIAPYKGELEIWYQQHASLWLDIKLIFLTAWVIVKPESDLPFRWLKGLPERPEYLK